MRWDKAVIVAKKEWRDVLGNKLLLASMSALPVVFTVMPVVLVAIASKTASEANVAQVRQLWKDVPPEMTAAQLMIRVLLQQWLAVFLMLPVFVPVVVSAYAVVGEKEKRTIEPLLASPVGTRELLLGKTAAAVLPGLLITWTSFAVFAGLVNLVAWPHFHRPVLPDGAWLAAMLLLAPGLAFLGNVLSVLVSSRVNDARLAQQLAGTAVVPLVMLIVLQVARGAAVGPVAFALGAVGVAVLDVVLYVVAVRLFDRERILTSLR